MVWVVPLASVKFIPHRLTPVVEAGGIRSLVGFGILVRSLAHPVLYPHRLRYEANPRVISGRTSYHQV